LPFRPGGERGFSTGARNQSDGREQPPPQAIRPAAGWGFGRIGFVMGWIGPASAICPLSPGLLLKKLRRVRVAGEGTSICARLTPAAQGNDCARFPYPIQSGFMMLRPNQHSAISLLLQACARVPDISGAAPSISIDCEIVRATSHRLNSGLQGLAGDGKNVPKLHQLENRGFWMPGQNGRESLNMTMRLPRTQPAEGTVLPNFLGTAPKPGEGRNPEATKVSRK